VHDDGKNFLSRVLPRGFAWQRASQGNGSTPQDGWDWKPGACEDLPCEVRNSRLRLVRFHVAAPIRCAGQRPQSGKNFSAGCRRSGFITVRRPRWLMAITVVVAPSSALFPDHIQRGCAVAPSPDISWPKYGLQDLLEQVSLRKRSASHAAVHFADWDFPYGSAPFAAVALRQVHEFSADGPQKSAGLFGAFATEVVGITAANRSARGFSWIPG